MAKLVLSDGAVSITRNENASRELIEKALSRIADPDGEGQKTFTRVFSESAKLYAEATDRLRAAGAQLSPLAGLPVSVKDLFDLCGEVTTAGSPSLSNAPAAPSDAAIVSRLRAAGAIIIGRTNMTEFAYSGIGLNPHLGTPANPYKREERRIPGGSSSGAAISVTDGMAWAAIGSDTGGSVRIPAALCGLTGFKPTQSRVPLQGAFQLSTTLDSIGPIASTVRDCILVDAAISGAQREERVPADLRHVRFILPRNYVLDALDKEVGTAFERALSRLSGAGAEIVEMPLPAFQRIRDINATGGFSGAEAYAFHRRLGLDQTRYDPLVLERIERGKSMSAADYLDMHMARAAIIAELDRETAGFDAVLSPTVPIIAPKISDVASSREEYRRINMLLLRNASIVNFVDGCALSIPCHTEGEAPVGLMLVGRRMSDAALLSLGLAVEELVAPQLPALRRSASKPIER
jgi:aspartyl-tRNA(Asn)/glutamyl-tRNA(Gln) amidotransferase subunit A